MLAGPSRASAAHPWGARDAGRGIFGPEEAAQAGGGGGSADASDLGGVWHRCSGATGEAWQRVAEPQGSLCHAALDTLAVQAAFRCDHISGTCPLRTRRLQCWGRRGVRSQRRVHVRLSTECGRARLPARGPPGGTCCLQWGPLRCVFCVEADARQQMALTLTLHLLAAGDRERERGERRGEGGVCSGDSRTGPAQGSRAGVGRGLRYSRFLVRHGGWVVSAVGWGETKKS